MQMNIEYIKHSGFMVEFMESVMVFDYFDGELKLPENKKHIYFFVSHKHADHFSFRIFEYAKQYQNITFILPNDMKMNEKYLERKQVPVEARENIQYVKKHDKVQLNEQVMIETLNSTDEGVAYIVNYQENENEVCFYHAGDLNWWTWIGETKQEEQDMERRFKEEMEKIRGREFDCAFVPLDPRQAERFFWGFDYFMKTTNAKRVFPMHCWEDYNVIHRFLEMEQSKEYRKRIISVHHQTEWFRIES